LKVHYRILKVVLVFLSALVPIILLYAINPESFNHTYNGRSYYLFFIWLIVLGFAFDWEKYAGAKISDTPVKSRVAFGLMLALPTSYLFAANFFGLNNALMEWASPYITGTLALERLGDLPLAAELLVFAFLFGVIFLYAYRWNGLKGFLPAVGLIAAVGLINLVTILYYGGGFTPFQILAPATAQTTASFLNLMGYRTMLVVSESNFVPTLLVISSQSSVVLRIGWPCAGVDSLLIYTVVILMFLGKISVPWLHRVAYFVVGAGVTFFINVLRIYTMFMIKLNHGDVGPFHDFYGQLYSTIWIVSYIMLIVVSRVLWSRFHERRQLNKSLKNQFDL
jgi:exosortase/archaeosortase family protein